MPEPETRSESDPRSEAEAGPEPGPRTEAEPVAEAAVVAEASTREVDDVPAKVLRPHVLGAKVARLGLRGGRHEHHQSC